MGKNRVITVDISEEGIQKKICPICKRVLWSSEGEEDKDADKCTHLIGEYLNNFAIDEPFKHLLNEIGYLVDEIIENSDINETKVEEIVGYNFSEYWEYEDIERWFMFEFVYEYQDFIVVQYSPVDNVMGSDWTYEYYIADNKRKPLEDYLKWVVIELNKILNSNSNKE